MRLLNHIHVLSLMVGYARRRENLNFPALLCRLDDQTGIHATKSKGIRKRNLDGNLTGFPGI